MSVNHTGDATLAVELPPVGSYILKTAPARDARLAALLWKLVCELLLMSEVLSLPPAPVKLCWSDEGAAAAEPGQAQELRS